MDGINSFIRDQWVPDIPCYDPVIRLTFTWYCKYDLAKRDRDFLGYQKKNNLKIDVVPRRVCRPGSSA